MLGRCEDFAFGDIVDVVVFHGVYGLCLGLTS